MIGGGRGGAVWDVCVSLMIVLCVVCDHFLKRGWDQILNREDFVGSFYMILSSGYCRRYVSKWIGGIENYGFDDQSHESVDSGME